MIMFRDLAAAFAITSAGIAGSYGVANAATVQPATVRAPHVTSCSVQLRVIAAAERGTAGAAALSAAGLPELARTARAATSLSGARQYGVALEASSAALNGCSRDMALPSWFHWAGKTSGSCITVWGQRAGHAGNTSARVCASG